MLELAVVSALFAGVAYLLDRGRRKEAETFLGAIELAIRGGTAEREAHRAQVDKLLVHIQAPAAAPFIANGKNIPKQYASAESDEEGWEAIKAQVENRG